MICAKSWQTPRRRSKACGDRRRDMRRLRVIGEVGVDALHQLDRAFENRPPGRKAFARIMRRRRRTAATAGSRYSNGRATTARASTRGGVRATISHAGVSAGAGGGAAFDLDARRQGDPQLRVGLADPRLDDPVAVKVIAFAHDLGRWRQLYTGGQHMLAAIVARDQAHDAARRGDRRVVTVGRDVGDVVDHASPRRLFAGAASPPCEKYRSAIASARAIRRCSIRRMIAGVHAARVLGLELGAQLTDESPRRLHDCRRRQSVGSAARCSSMRIAWKSDGARIERIEHGHVEHRRQRGAGDVAGAIGDLRIDAARAARPASRRVGSSSANCRAKRQVLIARSMRRPRSIKLQPATRLKFSSIRPESAASVWSERSTISSVSGSGYRAGAGARQARLEPSDELPDVLRQALAHDRGRALRLRTTDERRTVIVGACWPPPMRSAPRPMSGGLRRRSAPGDQQSLTAVRSTGARAASMC